ncbi:von Willebrand factor A domain-containing protein 5A [Sparganum proliferum]
MLLLLEDGSTYKPLSADPTKAQSTSIDKVLKRLTGKKQLSGEIAKYLKQTEPTIVRIYGLPKVHKAEVPLRPIVSLIGAPNYKISKWLFHKLNPLTKNCETSIENSTEFLKKLKGITVSSDEIMVSFDVVSLFTSIPLDLAKQCTEDLLQSCDTDVPAIALLELLDLCMETNFSFDQQYYQQLKGAPMGSPISGFLAEITMQKLEATALPLVNPKLWLRYVDDTFVIVKKDQLETLHNTINSTMPGIKFTLEKEVDKELPFLDVLVQRKTDGTLRTSVYRKQTYAEVILHYESNHPISHKRGFGGGLFDKNGTLPKDVPLKEISVHAEVHNLVADVTCKLVYKNDSKDLVETQFVFPIDSGAAVYNFEAEIGQKRLVAKCRERLEAKQTYQEAVDSGHTAFYMEEDELMGDTFAMKVGNIPPTETAVLKVQYFCQLQARNVTNDSGDCAVAVFALPSVLNPRYTPQSSETDRQFGPPTEVPLTTVTVPYKFSFSAGLTAQSPIVSVNSAKDVFELKYQTEDKKAATIALQSDFKFDHDLEMEIVFADPNKLMIAYEEGDSKEKSGILSLDCLTVDFLPVFKEETDTRNEVIFLIDRSGSMSGKNILQAKESLLLFLKSLPTDCRFQIVGFGSTFSALFDEPQDYTEDSMKAALEYQRNMSADMGGTEVFSALDSIYAKKITGAGWRRKIIFLTDGDIGNQTEVISLVRRNAKTTRLFAIGLGDGASTSLVTGVARAGGGKSAFVRNEQRLQPVVLHILQLALQPFASDVELTWSITGGDGKVAMPVVTIPDQLPNLYSDSYATVIGLVDNPKKLKLAGTVTLKFEVNGQTYTNIANVAEAELPRQNASGDLSLVFHRQAAKIQILELSDRHASLAKTSKVDEKEEKEAERIQKKIVALSTSTNVISRFTAFVGVDPEKLDCDGLTKVMKHIPRWTASSPLGPQSLMMCEKGTSRLKAASGMLLSRAPAVACCASGVAMNYCARSFQSFGAALDIMACAAPDLSDTRAGNEESPKDVLLAVAELQDLSGFWKLETGLADLLACQLDKLKSAKPQKIAGLEDAVWATALVVAFLKTKVADRRMEWQLMSKKAQTWLGSKLKSESSVNELINEAASVLATIPDTVKEK